MEMHQHHPEMATLEMLHTPDSGLATLEIFGGEEQLEEKPPCVYMREEENIQLLFQLAALPEEGVGGQNQLCRRGGGVGQLLQLRLGGYGGGQLLPTVSGWWWAASPTVVCMGCVDGQLLLQLIDGHFHCEEVLHGEEDVKAGVEVHLHGGEEEVLALVDVQPAQL